MSVIASVIWTAIRTDAPHEPAAATALRPHIFDTQKITSNADKAVATRRSPFGQPVAVREPKHLGTNLLSGRRPHAVRLLGANATDNVGWEIAGKFNLDFADLPTGGGTEKHLYEAIDRRYAAVASLPDLAPATVPGAGAYL